jgi:hypothetical protein
MKQVGCFIIYYRALKYNVKKKYNNNILPILKFYLLASVIDIEQVVKNINNG